MQSTDTDTDTGPDYAFDLLGVTRDTPFADVKWAYYQLAKLAHPDKGGSKEQMEALCNAYEIVKGTCFAMTSVASRKVDDIPSFNDIEAEACDASLEKLQSVLAELNVTLHPWTERVILGEYIRESNVNRLTKGTNLDMSDFLKGSIVVANALKDKDNKNDNEIKECPLTIEGGYAEFMLKKGASDEEPVPKMPARQMVTYMEPRSAYTADMDHPLLIPKKIEDYSNRFGGDYMKSFEPIMTDDLVEKEQGLEKSKLALDDRLEILIDARKRLTLPRNTVKLALNEKK